MTEACGRCSRDGSSLSSAGPNKARCSAQSICTMACNHSIPLLTMDSADHVVIDGGRVLRGCAFAEQGLHRG